METKTKQEEYGTDRMSFPTFTEWSWGKLKEWNYQKKSVVADKERAKRLIEDLKADIVKLRNDIKTYLPKKPNIDYITYNYAKADAKDKAEKEGWNWVEPETEEDN